MSHSFDCFIRQSPTPGTQRDTLPARSHYLSLHLSSLHITLSISPSLNCVFLPHFLLLLTQPPFVSAVHQYSHTFVHVLFFHPSRHPFTSLRTHFPLPSSHDHSILSITTVSLLLSLPLSLLLSPPTHPSLTSLFSWLLLLFSFYLSFFLSIYLPIYSRVDALLMIKPS